ncbi:MAG: LexA family transcriptional regulator [Cohaesibacter sp.]|jgi:DNA-binding XRE family transcriptional regulator|nr:LexA family transcriptional regulator [Cohaesibacter sp.]
MIHFQDGNSKNVSFSDIDVSKLPCNIPDMGILTEARKAAGLTQEELAERCDVTRITIVRLEKQDGISKKWAEKLSPILNVPISTLMLGNSPTPPSKSETGDLEPSPSQLGVLPIRGEVAAGVWREYDELAQDLGEPTEYAATVMMPGYPQEHQFALTVRGESLNKIAPNGATLHCIELINGGAWDIKEGELVIVQRSKFQGQMIETTAKRVRKNGNWELWPESDHPDFQEPLKVADYQKEDCDEEIRILAKVISITRSP